MKKLILTLLLVAYATAAFAIVDNSKHDMPYTLGLGEKRICAFCHTPHHANVVGIPGTTDYMPLWSHAMTSESFSPYNSDTFDGNNVANTMTGPSILCMSCHDGVVAPDAYYGDAVGTVSPEGDVWNGYGVGQFGDMSNDHPIGFDYIAARTTEGANRFGNYELRDAGDLLPAGYGPEYISDVLHDGTMMTCASCHDVHNGDMVVNKGQGYFLYGEQTDSHVCTMCHLK